MGHKQELAVFIGVQWAGALQTELHTNLAPILKKFEKTPLVWVTPSAPYLEAKSHGMDILVTEIKTRLSRLKDFIIPMGYSGAPHPLLLASELDRELAWSLKNPWGSGVLTLFKKNPEFLIPTVADFTRSAAIQSYSKNGFRFIGIPLPESTAAYSFLGPALGGELQVFYYFPVTGSRDIKISSLAKAIFPKNPSHLFLMMSIADKGSLDSLSSFLDELARRFPISITTPEAFSRFGEPAETLPGPLYQLALSIEDTPLTRVVREKVARLRAQDRLSNDDMNKVLCAIACARPDREKARQALDRKKPPREEIVYTAHMPGEILLPGKSFDVFFSAGRLADLRQKETSFLPRGKMRSYLCLKNKEHPLIFDRIFSFENNDVHGLETWLFVPYGKEREHLVTIRSSFIGEFPWLIISAKIQYRFACAPEEIRQIVPLEIPIVEFEQGETVLFRSLYSDASYSETTLDGKTALTALTGSVFSVGTLGKHLVFGPVPAKRIVTDRLELIVRKEKKIYTVAINPFGTYIPALAAKTRGFVEYRSFFLGIREEMALKPPFFPNAVLKNLPLFPTSLLE